MFSNYVPSLINDPLSLFFADGHKNKENICGWLVSKHSSGRREAVF